MTKEKQLLVAADNIPQVTVYKPEIDQLETLRIKRKLVIQRLLDIESEMTIKPDSPNIVELTRINISKCGHVHPFKHLKCIGNGSFKPSLIHCGNINCHICRKIWEDKYYRSMQETINWDKEQLTQYTIKIHIDDLASHSTDTKFNPNQIDLKYLKVRLARLFKQQNKNAQFIFNIVPCNNEIVELRILVDSSIIFPEKDKLGVVVEIKSQKIKRRDSYKFVHTDYDMSTWSNSNLEKLITYLYNKSLLTSCRFHKKSWICKDVQYPTNDPKLKFEVVDNIDLVMEAGNTEVQAKICHDHFIDCSNLCKAKLADKIVTNTTISNMKIKYWRQSLDTIKKNMIVFAECTNRFHDIVKYAKQNGLNSFSRDEVIYWLRENGATTIKDTYAKMDDKDNLGIINYIEDCMLQHDILT